MVDKQMSSTSRKSLATSLLLWVWNVRNLDKKNRRAKYGAQFQSITVEIKERIEHRIRQSDFPTKPPADRHSTNFTKEHKSLNVSHQWNYRSHVSLFNLDERNWPIFLFTVSREKV